LAPSLARRDEPNLDDELALVEVGQTPKEGRRSTWRMALKAREGALGGSHHFRHLRLCEALLGAELDELLRQGHVRFILLPLVPKVRTPHPLFQVRCNVAVWLLATRSLH
jgi:hypothetical protein